jgi:large conductance mechanosensitive channel
MWKDFKAFIMRGNVLDLAVAVVIGAAFGGIVKSLVDDIIMPPIGLILGKVDFSNLFVVLKDGTKTPPPYATLAAAKDAGAVTINYGMFINNLIGFLIVAAAVFMIVRIVSRWYAKPAPPTATTKPCPYCTLSIPLEARRCPNCTAEIGLVSAA